MPNFSIKTLKHLENSIPEDISGYSLGFYSIALEAWRRGLNVKFLNKNVKNKASIKYEISSLDKKYIFSGSRNLTLAKEVSKITGNKQKTKDYLLQKNVPTPEGKSFGEESKDDDIIQFGKQLGFPLVVKPVNGHAGIGVIADIRTIEELENALGYVRKELKYKNLIVEKYFEGEDYRVFVVGEEVVAITKRYPANVLGNGQETIRQLIKKKNELRLNHPMLSSSRIKIDSELKDMLTRQNYTLDSIPKKDKLVLLKSKNNISSGGDPVDITDEVSDKIKQIAIEALKAIPDLKNAGVDLIVNETENSAVVLEINAQASIRSHLYPIYGEPRDVPSKLIDLYFPETKSVKKNKKIFFLFNKVWDNFQKGIFQEYTLPAVPQNPTVFKKLVVEGNVYNVNFGSWVRKQARIFKLHGHVKHLNNNKTEIVIMGNEIDINQFQDKLLNGHPDKVSIDRITEKEINYPIPCGFRLLNSELDRIIKDGYFPQRIEEISELRRPEKKRSSTKQEKKKVATKKDSINKDSTINKKQSPKRKSILIRLLKKVYKKVK